MRLYKVTQEVEYVIKASSLDEAIKLVQEDSEHPLVGGNEIGYCSGDRVIGGMLIGTGEVNA